jgi:lipopolysaccharide export LptBFGC system permease protein LptF
MISLLNFLTCKFLYLFYNFFLNMVLFLYITRQFFLYWCILSVFFAIIFSLVELLEKLIRAKETAFYTIITFIGMNFFPTVISLMVMNAALSTCLLLLKMYISGEWETFKLINIRNIRLVATIAACSFVLMLLLVIFNENIVSLIYHKACIFKEERLKKTVPGEIIQKWHCLKKGTLYCYFDSFNTLSKEGRGIVVVNQPLLKIFGLENAYFLILFTFYAIFLLLLFGVSYYRKIFP